MLVTGYCKHPLLHIFISINVLCIMLIYYVIRIWGEFLSTCALDLDVVNSLCNLP